MFLVEIATNNHAVKLIRPDVERDARLGVEWLAGESGCQTLRKMGVVGKDNQPTTLEQETARVHGFLENQNQLNWMISKNEQVVGAIWVDLEPTEYLGAPSIHIMIGDLAARGQGIGSQAFRAVINHLQGERNEPAIYTRHLSDNVAATRIAEKAGFRNDGKPYYDKDNLQWQNMEKINDL